MKRILITSLSIACALTGLSGCATKPTPVPDTASVAEAKARTAADDQRLREEFSGAQALVVLGCSEKLHIASVDHPEDMAAIKTCTDTQVSDISNAVLARLEAGEFPANETGQFILRQAVVFLQTYSEGARSRDSDQLIQSAMEHVRGARSSTSE
jgi:hypothetical protein